MSLNSLASTRVARETFHVPHVVARIYDPGRAEIYQRLGIPTVAAVRWSADQVLRRILPEQHLAGDFREPSGRLVLAELDLDAGWIGHAVSSIEKAADIRIAYLTRFGEGILPAAGTAYQDGDTVHAMLQVGRSSRVAQILAKAPAKESQ